MKKCPVCGIEHNDEALRCAACGTMLPDVSVGKRTSSKRMKLCSKCGEENEVTRIRCVKCGALLPDPTIRKTDSAVFHHKLIKATGEELQLENGMILGRAYQPDFWDVYTPRAFLRVYEETGRLVLEWLKAHRKETVSAGASGKIGRIEFRIE